MPIAAECITDSHLSAYLCPWSVDIPRFHSRGWIQLIAAEQEGNVQKVENLIALFNLGHFVGQLRYAIAQPGATPISVPFFQVCGLLRTELDHMLAGEPLPFKSTISAMDRLKTAIDTLYADCKLDESKFDAPLKGIHLRELTIGMQGLELHLKQELDALPIWLVTARRAYSIDILVNRAEGVLEMSDAALLSQKTIDDLRQAGRCIAFDVPTAAGFHSVRAVEAVARGYHDIIVGIRPIDETPLGPLINALRIKRDALLGVGSIDKEDLLNIVIDFLTRVNNVYRKPLTHPDMVLNLPRAMTVFDSSKCAIELMLEDATNKYATPPIPHGFF